MKSLFLYIWVHINKKKKTFKKPDLALKANKFVYTVQTQQGCRDWVHQIGHGADTEAHLVSSIT